MPPQWTGVMEMCGIFGLVRSGRPDGEIPARALLTLGTLAEARGIDAAGLACWTGAPGRTPGGLPTVAGQPVATLDGWRIHKRPGRVPGPAGGGPAARPRAPP